MQTCSRRNRRTFVDVMGRRRLGSAGMAPQFTIQEEDQARILALCQVAVTNNSALTVSELVDAMSTPASIEDLEAAWGLNSVLSSRYSLESGWILERNAETALELVESLSVQKAREQRANRNLRVATDFAALCVGSGVRLVAVSGGNSYRRAGPSDDIDLFCVTKADSLWPFMLRSLLLARIYRWRRRYSPQFCFSYVLDERRATRDFSTEGDGLFARDALMARVVYGGGAYLSLLRNAPWMKEYFPKLYRMKFEDQSSKDAKGEEGEPGPRASAWSGILNSYLYYTVGAYIRLKAYLLNRRYRKEGKRSAVFRAEVSKDGCVYESNRYRGLRFMYDFRANSQEDDKEEART